MPSFIQEVLSTPWNIAPRATSLCRSLVSERVKVETADSVAFLRRIVDAPPSDLSFVDLLYLHSYDVDWDNITPSAVHHLKGSSRSSRLSRPRHWWLSTIHLEVYRHGQRKPLPAGRASRYWRQRKILAEYAAQVGAVLAFQSYQCGWMKLRAPAGKSP